MLEVLDPPFIEEVEEEIEDEQQASTSNLDEGIVLHKVSSISLKIEFVLLQT